MVERVRVGGIEAATRDLVVSARAARIEAALAMRGMSVGVSFHDDIATVLGLAEDLSPISRDAWGAGGTVANTLYAMARAAAGAEPALSLCWLGVSSVRDSAMSTEPLSSLRRVGVTVESAPHDGDDRLALCLVAEETGEALAVLLAPRDYPVEPRPTWPEVDLLIVTLQRAETMSRNLGAYIERAPALAILVGDVRRIAPTTLSLLESWAKAGRLRWLFGQAEDFERLGLMRAERAAPAFASVEMVGTRGPDETSIWEPLARRCLRVPVPPVPILPPATVLGAGDAYAGGYLRARLHGTLPRDAHLAALDSVQQVLEVRASRVPMSNDLNRLFGPIMAGRESRTEGEGALFDEVRLTCGVAVVTCGQTGVDQLALSAAADLGLAAFAIMPEGLRTEATECGIRDTFGDARVFELGSKSYRYCTWTNVFLADGTLLWDYRGSEGCEATREACAALHRPFLDLASLSLEEGVTAARNWADRHAVRIVHVAGNRRSLLHDQEVTGADVQIRRVLTALAFNRSRLATAGPSRNPSRSPPETPRIVGYGGLRVGIPNTRESRHLFSAFLHWACNYEVPSDRRVLHWRVPEQGLEVLLARVRDLPRMLDLGLLDLILCGSDILHEHGDVHPALLNTGLQPCLLVVLGRRGDGRLPRVVASQYPAIAAGVIGTRRGIERVESILGAAEAWIASGWVDGAVDTWRTGATAASNGLEVVTVLRSTYLVAAVSSHSGPPYSSGVERILSDFESWLADGAIESWRGYGGAA